MDENENDVIAVYASESGTRRLSVTKLRIDELTLNVNLFLDQVGRMLEKTPSSVGAFHFVEFEVSAEISAKGSLVLLGTGGEGGAKGGLKFVFRRGTGTA